MRLYYFKANKKIDLNKISENEFNLYNNHALITLNNKHKLITDESLVNENIGLIEDSIIQIQLKTKSYEHSIDNAKIKANMIKDRFNFNECEIIICDENEKIIDSIIF